ncbi:hypothetical protein DRP43_01430, partial [candidate division TA06 bacterium]
PKTEKYDCLKREEQGLMDELNRLKLKIDSLTPKKNDKITKYSLEMIKSELKLDSIRIWESDMSVRLEVDEGRIFDKGKGVPTERGEKTLYKLLSNVSRIGGDINIEVLLGKNQKDYEIKIKRAIEIMNRLIKNHNKDKENVKISIYRTQKGLEGINIELE